MALNIKNEAVERLAGEVASLTGETKTEAIRKALEERKHRLLVSLREPGREPARAVVEREIWAMLPQSLRGRGVAYLPVEDVLGFGPEGF